MQWTPEAEEAVAKVPFFVRKRVRARVENEARREGKSIIGLAEVKNTQKRYLAGMAAEVRGYQLEACFGPSGCPNRIEPEGEGLAERLEQLLQKADLRGFLTGLGISELKFHHEFRIALADCPNACSQPQIKDIGILAAHVPQKGAPDCVACNACVDACREQALGLDDTPAPVLHAARCVACGQCLAVCPTGSLTGSVKGYRVQLGGKLGRRPRLARELPGIFDAAAVLDIVEECLSLYRSKCRRGERFGELLEADDFDRLAGRFGSRSLV